MKRLLPLLLAAPAFADPIAERGSALGCGESCTLVAAGFILTVDPASDPKVLTALRTLAPLTAVSFEGDLGEMGDITAPVTLTALKPEPDDLYQDTLRALQGEWKPDGEETPFVIRIDGMQWDEVTEGEVSASYLIQPSEACADGVTPGGIALSLIPMSGDPASAPCWQLEYIDDKTLDLRDFSGDQGQVSFLRQ